MLALPYLICIVEELELLREGMIEDRLEFLDGRLGRLSSLCAIPAASRCLVDKLRSCRSAVCTNAGGALSPYNADAIDDGTVRLTACWQRQEQHRSIIDGQYVSVSESVGS